MTLRESQADKRGREDLRDELKKRADWEYVDEYARYVASKRAIDILAALHRRVETWRSDEERNQFTDTDGVTAFRDCRDYVAELLRELGADDMQRETV